MIESRNGTHILSAAPSEPTAELLPRVLALLAEVARQGEPFRAFFQGNGLRASLKVAPIAEAPAPAQLPAVGAGKGREFSPTEQAVIAVMTKDWQTKVEISDACKIPVGSQFCTLLTNLVDREYLDSGHRGYRLAQ